MPQSYKFLRVSVKVFKGLAWLALAVQVITGLILIVRGGEPVVIAGADIPARMVGILNFVAAGMYFFTLTLTSHLIQLGLDIRDQLQKGS